MDIFNNNKKKQYNDIIDEINDNRDFIVKYEKKENLINMFEKNNSSNQELKEIYNDDVINYRSNGLRIMTYNVHFGTNHKTEQNLGDILELIKKINPDILCLNELTTNKTEFNDEGFPNQIGNLIHFSFCSITPSWFYSPYGTSVYINIELINHAYLSGFPNCSFPTKKNCTLNQNSKTFTFDNNNPNPDIETRCFIKFSLKDFDIICVHLEPYSEEVRIKQLKEIDREINKEIARKTIIMGDFNIFNEKDFETEILKNIKDIKNKKRKFSSNKNKYAMKKLLTSIDYKPTQTTTEIKLIKEQFGWIDSFELSDMIPISYTNWTGIRVDYIFFTKEWKKKDIIFSRTYFSNESDHLPIICDIIDNFYFSIQYDIDYYDDDLRTIEDENRTEIQKLTYINQIGEKPKMITHNEFINYYQKHIKNVKNKRMAFGGQIKEINNINDIFLYNGQTSNNISWFKKQEILEHNPNYQFKDPTMTSNEPKQINLGGFGIYATDSLDFSLNYAVQFTKKKVNEGSFPVIFIFKTNLNTQDIDNLKIGMINYRLTMRNYEESFDNEYHMIFLNDRQFQHNSIQIKFTKLFFEDYQNKMELVKILNLGDEKYNNLYYENPKRYKLPEQKIFNFGNIYLIYKYLSAQYKNYDNERINQIIETDISENTVQDKINRYINIHINDLEGGKKYDYNYKYFKYIKKLKR
jgi:endonuclease/exonuclease/phosphatase family metal-dependent hydrolase